MSRTIFIFLLKLAFSVGCLWLVSTQVDFKSFWHALGGMSSVEFAICILIYMSHIVPVAVRWQYFVTELGQNQTITLWSAIRQVAVSNFLNQAFLGTIAGDAARIGYLTSQHYGLIRATGGIILDRYIALLIMWLGAFLAVPFLFQMGLSDKASQALQVFLWMICGALMSLPLAGLFVHLPILRRRPSLYSKLQGLNSLSKTFWATLSQRRAWLPVYGTSVYVLLSTVAIIWFIAAELDMVLEIELALAITPIALLVAAVPISVAGWGPREASFLTLLAFSGNTTEAILAMSVIFGFSGLSAALIGGMIWFLPDKKQSLHQIK